MVVLLESNMSADQLTPKQEAFALGYVETGSATEAYRRAYNTKTMAPQTLWSNASHLLDNTKVAARIASLNEKAAERAGITKERWLRELAILAFAEIADVTPWDADGPRLIPSDKLTRDKRAAVKTIKVKRERQYRGRDEDAEPWEVEHFELVMHDKKGALDAIGKAMGWHADKLDINITITREDRIAAVMDALHCDREDAERAVEEAERIVGSR